MASSPRCRDRCGGGDAERSAAFAKMARRPCKAMIPNLADYVVYLRSATSGAMALFRRLSPILLSMGRRRRKFLPAPIRRAL
jgi:hypothetical protein